MTTTSPTRRARRASASAMLIPKPTPRDRMPFIPALWSYDLGNMLGSLAPIERRALTQIAEAADLLMVEDRPWLLVPAPPWLIEVLAMLNAECEDREPYVDDEEQPDDEDNHDTENDRSDYEPEHDDEPDYRHGPFPD